MKFLLKLQRSLKIFYNKNAVWVQAVLKFVLASAVFHVIQMQFGFERTMQDYLIVTVLAFVSAFLSTNTISLLAGVFIIGNLSSLSLEALGIGSVIVLIVGLLYFGMGPKESCALLLMPIALSFHLPSLIPVLFGLIGGVSAVWGIVAGTILYYVTDTITGSSYMISSGTGMDEILRHVMGVLGELADMRDMAVMLIILLIVFAVVSILRRMAVDYAWYLAIGAGVFSYVLLTVIAMISFGSSESFIWTVISAVVTILAALLTQILKFHVDYRRTEKLQFEDDEYYYYVKAVPKYGRRNMPAVQKEMSMQEEMRERQAAPIPQRREEARERQAAPIPQRREEVRRYQESEIRQEPVVERQVETEREMTEEEVREQHRQEWLRIRTEQGGSRYDRRKGG
ncbi:MAG: hypothetical protein SO016_13175 [Lachnospiraceae bacterium]|nr:hypothetical protein [Robinsoniella sp.]MDY3767616.1 hypothetical protein [Lachnospiraceae bacterium]